MVWDKKEQAQNIFGNFAPNIFHFKMFIPCWTFIETNGIGLGLVHLNG